MQTKTKLKMAVDAGMAVLLPILMAYMLTGQEVHEWVGAAMFVLFLLHHALNMQWWSSVRKGRYTPMRVVTLAFDLLLLADMACLMVSGIVMSRYVFDFLPIEGGMALARLTHMAASYWGFVLMSAHLGMHWNMVIGMARKGLRAAAPARRRAFCLHMTAALIALYGLFAFWKHEIASYLFLRVEFVFFDYEQSPILFFAEYLAMMGLFAALAHYLTFLLRRRRAAAEQLKSERT